MIELGTVALVIAGMAAAIKFFVVNPYRGARHIANVVRPNADGEEKEESKEVLRVVGNQTLNYFGFLGSCLLILVFSIPIALLHLPYVINLILGFSAAAFLAFSYYHFQNRDY
jgi:hypothetical protein